MAECLRLAERVLDSSGGDVTAGNLVVESPVLVAYALRGTARWCLGIPGWKDDLRSSVALGRGADPATRALVTLYTYGSAVPNGILLPDATVLRETGDALEVLEQHGDNFSLNVGRLARAVVLTRRDGSEREEAFELFASARDEIINERFGWVALPIADTHLAAEKARTGDIDDAIALARSVLDDRFDGGESINFVPATTVLVQALLSRGAEGDLWEAQTVIDRLAAAFPTDPGMALVEVPSLRLRALLARAHGDEAGYREFRDRYRKMATDLGFEGHIVWAEAMP
jgi:adenylate cyclase